MLETGKQIKSQGAKKLPLLITAGLAAALGSGAYLFWKDRSQRPPPQVVLSDDARAYLPSLDLEGVEMAATENTLGHTLVEITGTIKNLGDRPVRSIRLTCVFFDPHGVELHRALTTIVRARDGLAPAGESAFRLPFDDIPEGWDQTLPRLYIAEIVFD